MDPKAALISADQLISDENYSEAVYILGGYATWRFKGGFEPIVDSIRNEKKGDRIFDRLITILADRMVQAGIDN